MAGVGERFSQPEQHVETRDEKNYRKMLDDYLGPATFVIALLLASVILRFQNQAAAEAIADELAISPDEQQMINPPLARLLDKQHFAPEIKKRIQESGDAAGLLIGLGAYLVRVSATLGQLATMQKEGLPYEQPRSASSQQAAQQQPAAEPARPAYVGVDTSSVAGFGTYRAA